MSDLNLYILKPNVSGAFNLLLITRYNYNTRSSDDYVNALLSPFQVINDGYFYEELIGCNVGTKDFNEFAPIEDRDLLALNSIRANQYRLGSSIPDSSLSIHPNLGQDLRAHGYSVMSRAKVNSVKYNEMLINFRYTKDSRIVKEYLKEVTPELFL